MCQPCRIGHDNAGELFNSGCTSLDARPVLEYVLDFKDNVFLVGCFCCLLEGQGTKKMISQRARRIHASPL